MTIMLNSYLIQRLEKPNFIRKKDGTIVDNPFTFGCCKNGRLSDQAMELLRPIFGFEYMGAAEFEFGAVPEALSRMAKETLVKDTITVKTSDKGHAWHGEKEGVCEATIYVICQKDQHDEVVKRIKQLGTEYSIRTKEHVGLESSIRQLFGNKEVRTLGWLELSNGFFFFIDKAMWEKTCKLFEI